MANSELWQLAQMKVFKLCFYGDLAIGASVSLLTIQKCSKKSDSIKISMGELCEYNCPLILDCLNVKIFPLREKYLDQ